MAFIDSRSNPPVALLLIGVAAYNEDDSLVLGAIARDVGFRPLLLPHVLVQPPLDTVASGTQTFDAIVAASDVDISLPSDDRPYFFQFEKGIPFMMVHLVSLTTVVTAVLVMIFALRLRGARGVLQRGYPPFFAMLGIGFIAIDLAVRGIIAFLSLLPLALVMGVPFPQALKLIGREEK